MSSGQSKVSAFPKIGVIFLNEGRCFRVHSPVQYSGPVFIYPTILFNYLIQLSYSTIVSNYLIRIINALQAKRAILAIQAWHLRPPRKESPSLSQRTVSSISSDSSYTDIIRSGEDAFAFMNWPRPDTESLHRRMPITGMMITEGVDNQGLLPCFE